MISTITFEHGEKTCAIKTGEFCKWFGQMGFGTRHVCLLFDNEPLFDRGEPKGWLKRCDKCIEQFGTK